MSEYKCVEFYELMLRARYQVAKKDKPLPPIVNVPIWDTFKLLADNKVIIGKQYLYSNELYATSLEYLNVQPTHIDIVFGFFDKTAPNRTLKDSNTQTETVQPRKEHEFVKYLCHCVIKRANHDCIAHIGIERVSGFPSSRVKWCLNKVLLTLSKSVSNAEGIFQITNADGAKKTDGSAEVDTFILAPELEPIAGDMLQQAIRDKRLKRIRVRGEKFTGFDDSRNDIQALSAELSFGISTYDPNTDKDEKSFLKRLLTTVLKNKPELSNVRTYAVISPENEPSREQSVEVDMDNDLRVAFVKRKWFDAKKGREAHPDNTQINKVFLATILNIF